MRGAAPLDQRGAVFGCGLNVLGHSGLLFMSHARIRICGIAGQCYFGEVDSGGSLDALPSFAAGCPAGHAITDRDAAQGSIRDTLPDRGNIIGG